MDAFSYLSVLLSIILGLGLTQVLTAGYRTADLSPAPGHAVGTAEFGAQVCEALAEIADRRHAYHAV